MRTEHSSSILVRLSVLVTALVFIFCLTVPGATIVEAAGAPRPVLATSVVVDGVTITVKSPVLPQSHFSAPMPDQGNQIAIMTTIHPYRELSISAVPFGVGSSMDDLPIAAAGSDTIYRAELHSFRMQQKAQTIGTPIAFLFGKMVQGEADLVDLPLHGVSPEPAVLIEWVREAGNREWIVRMTVEVSYAASAVGGVRGFVQAASSLVVASKNAGAASTLINSLRRQNNAHASQTASSAANIPASASASLPFPSWWNGNCDANNYPGSFPLGDSYLGTPACGPRPDWDCNPSCNHGVYFFPGAVGPVLEWQCVELSLRVLYLAYGVAPYSANGNQIVSNYSGSALSKISNGSGQAPVPGDVISFDDSNPAGHTAVVASSNVSNGSGTIYVLQQNFGGSGYGNDNDLMPMTVSGGTLQDENGLHATGWLHPNAGASQSGVNTQDVYALGANQSLYDYHWSLQNGWSIDSSMNSLTPQGVSLTGTPGSNTFTISGSVYGHVVAVSNTGQLYEYWRRIGGGWGFNNLSSIVPPPSGVSFVGSPSVYSYTVPGQSTTRHSIYVLGSDSNLYYYAWTQGSGNGTWTLTNITQQRPLPSGVTPTGIPAGNAFPIGSGEDQHVVVVGSNGHLYEFWQSIGGNWYLNDLSTLAAPPSGVSFVGSPSVYSYTVPGQTGTNHSIYVLGSDNNLYYYGWKGSSNTWTLSNLTQLRPLPSGVTPTGTPAGDAFPIGSGEDQHTLVVGSDGHLYEFWQSIGGNWYLNDLSTLTSSTVAVTGSPTSYSYVLQGQTAERHSIQVVTSDGHLREYVWVQGSGSGTWSVLDHGIPSGTTLAGSSPNGEVYSS